MMYLTGEAQQALEKTNSTAKVLNMHLRSRLHEESERYMVQVVDIEKTKGIKNPARKTFEPGGPDTEP